MTEEQISLHLQISKGLKKKLKIAAANEDRLIKDIVIQAIENYLKDGSSKKTG